MITIITSCYKSNKDFFKQTIKSILNQTYQDFEYLIKDDGIEFNVEEFLSEFNDKRIKLIKAPHMGNVNSTNLLIEKAKGDYITIQDHDDISLPNRLELSLQEFLKDNTLVSVSGRIHIFGDTKERDDGKEMLPNQITEELLFFQPIKHPSVMINRKYFIENNIKLDSNYTYANDFELWSRIRNDKHKIVNNILVKYRKHSTNLTSNKQKLRNEHALIVQRNLKQIDINAPIELCKMLDPYDHNKYNYYFVELFKQNKNKLLKHISNDLYNRKFEEISKKTV